jgi:hypothetical protein
LLDTEQAKGYAPYSHYFCERSRRYYFKPNLKLLVAVLPELMSSGRPPRRVICPMAGVGAAPVMVLAFYRRGTTAVAWEENEEWRPVCAENLGRNSFCCGRYEIAPPESWGWGDAAVIASAPRQKFTDVRRWYGRLEENLRHLGRCLRRNSVLLYVGRRVDQGYHEYVRTENLFASALHGTVWDRVEDVRYGAVSRGEGREDDDVFAVVRLS